MHEKPELSFFFFFLGDFPDGDFPESPFFSFLLSVVESVELSMPPPKMLTAPDPITMNQ
jgi:hypothetical protein